MQTTRDQDKQREDMASNNDMQSVQDFNMNQIVGMGAKQNPGIDGLSDISGIFGTGGADEAGDYDAQTNYRAGESIASMADAFGNFGHLSTFGGKSESNKGPQQNQNQNQDVLNALKAANLNQTQNKDTQVKRISQLNPGVPSLDMNRINNQEPSFARSSTQKVVEPNQSKGVQVQSAESFGPSNNQQSNHGATTEDLDQSEQQQSVQQSIESLGFDSDDDVDVVGVNDNEEIERPDRAAGGFDSVASDVSGGIMEIQTVKLDPNSLTTPRDSEGQPIHIPSSSQIESDYDKIEEMPAEQEINSSNNSSQVEIVEEDVPVTVNVMYDLPGMQDNDDNDNDEFDISHLETTGIDTQIDILDNVAVDNEQTKNYGVYAYEIRQGVLFFKITIPNGKPVYRRMEQLIKFRQFIAQKWFGFVPLPQLTLEIMGNNKNTSNDQKVFLVNQFIKDIVKYLFITNSDEFNILFNGGQKMMSIQEFDAKMKPVLLTLKSSEFMKNVLNRYQKIKNIDIRSIQTAHLQTCRDFITRFQNILNTQVKVLLKLVFRFEKQLNEEQKNLAEQNLKNANKQTLAPKANGVNQSILNELFNYERKCMDFFDENDFSDDDSEQLTNVQDSLKSGSILNQKVDIPTGQGSTVVKGSYLHGLRLKVNAYDQSTMSRSPQLQVKDNKKQKKFQATNDIIQDMQESYNYFLNDLCNLFSVKECIVAMESTTRKEHYSIQQTIFKLNNQATKYTNNPGFDLNIQQTAPKKGGITGMFKSIKGKISGKPTMSESELFAEIKSQERKLKTVDQLQTYQTVFICQVVIPNFNMRRRHQADSFIKGVICRKHLLKLQKEIDMWDAIRKEIQNVHLL